MEVTVVSATQNPMDVIGFAAGVCYGKRDNSHKRVIACINNGHHSVLEHASVTLFIQGISRACLAQLTRHRVASYSVESQRYCTIDTGGEWAVCPAPFDNPRINAPAFDNRCEAQRIWQDAMDNAATFYNALLKVGAKPEDARSVLPNACCTNLVMTMNVRELQHFLTLREGVGAQGEIMSLAYTIEYTLRLISDQWATLIDALEAVRASD